MSGNLWGKYLNDEPITNFDPLQSFMHEGHPVGFRVNFMPGRSNRPREQRISTPKSFVVDDITEEEIDNSPLYQVIVGKEKCVPIAADTEVLGDPIDEPITMDFTEFSALSIMNKYSPVGIFSEEATGTAIVNFPTTYTRTLDNAQINYHVLRTMKTSMKHLIEGDTYRDDLNTPLSFFNIGPSSGASLRILHSQCYAVTNYGGINTYGFQQSFQQNKDDCLACRIADEDKVNDHLGQEIDYAELTIWENEHCRVIVPYAPLRSMGTRIIPKTHAKYIGNSRDNLLKSIGKALSIADYLMNAATPSGRSVRLDRTIPFRQTGEINKDFHFFIDILPPFPFVAAETTDFLGMTPYSPEYVASLMQEVDISHIENKHT